MANIEVRHCDIGPCSPYNGRYLQNMRNEIPYDSELQLPTSLLSYNENHINERYSQNILNEMHSDSEVQLPRLTTYVPNENRNDVDFPPTYNEIYHCNERSLPVTFDQVSLPPYESIVNCSMEDPEISLPIRDSVQRRDNCCFLIFIINRVVTFLFLTMQLLK